MADKDRLDHLRRTLERGAGVRCREVRKLLESLGFEVREGKKQGHRVFVHPGLTGFFAGSFSCGHGPNPEVKRPYLKKIIKIIDEYESELRHYAGEGK